jgi:hypothetical protein
VVLNKETKSCLCRLLGYLEDVPSNMSSTITFLMHFLTFFLIGIVGSGIQLGPLGTTATNRPIMPAPGDYGDGEIGGMMICRENGRTRTKSAPVQLCPPQKPHACPDANPGCRGGKPATNCLSYGTATFSDLSHTAVHYLLNLNEVSFMLDLRFS